MEYNQTLSQNPSLCTLETCPIEWAPIHYAPSLAGNVFFLLIFSSLMIVQIGMGIRYGRWGITVAMVSGMVLEILSYLARIRLSQNPFDKIQFLICFVGLTVAPAFFSATIYLSFSRIIATYPPHVARFRPKTYSILFICCDFIAIILQVGGGGLADTAATDELSQTGVDVMVAGLSFQVASLFLFFLLVADFMHNVRARHWELAGGPLISFPMWKLRAFEWAQGIAAVCIFIRSCFRVAELSQGFGGSLANDQITFTLLESTMISAATIAQTICHPGLIGQGEWSRDEATISTTLRDKTWE